MIKQSKKPKKGFTIIEVVLVLAIAGLIFLMVFVALPALQRSQRNTQREDDLSRFLSAVTDYQSNNGGQTPFQRTDDLKITQFVTRYIDDSCDKNESYQRRSPRSDACDADQFRDPDGTIYAFYYLGTFENAVWNGANAAIAQFGGSGEYTESIHRVYVVSSAMCGNLEGSIVRAVGERYVAMLMVLEGGGITCVTNGARGEVGPGDHGTFYLYSGLEA